METNRSVNPDAQATMEPMGSVLFTNHGDGVATVTLNRPDRLNAIDHGPGSMQENALHALQRADADPTIRCVVVTGAGRAFCSGGVLTGGLTDGVGDEEEAGPRKARDWYGFHRTEDTDSENTRATRKPTIAAINGLCYGAGLMFASHLDLLVAHEDATFGLIETRFGSIGVDVLPFHVGAQNAKYMAIGGELFTARQAQRLGLVLAVIERDLFREGVYDLARRIAAMPETAVELNTDLVNTAVDFMGWPRQKKIARVVNSITNEVMPDQKAANGRPFSELIAEGWKSFKDARDEPYRKPWLPQ